MIKGIRMDSLNPATVNLNLIVGFEPPSSLRPDSLRSTKASTCFYVDTPFAT